MRVPGEEKVQRFREMQPEKLKFESGYVNAI